MKMIKLMMMTLMMCLGMTSFGQKTANYKQVISKEVKGDLTSYTTQSGETFSVGDTITLGTAFRNENFDYIQQMFTMMQFYPLPNTASGSKVVIKDIQVMSKSVFVKTTNPQGFVYGLYISNFEGAVANGEIKSNTMTSDQALSELKKWKDKLDLGLITQEEFDKKKAELSVFIK